jgi:hypothetical protein
MEKKKKKSGRFGSLFTGFWVLIKDREGKYRRENF